MRVPPWKAVQTCRKGKQLRSSNEFCGSVVFGLNVPDPINHQCNTYIFQFLWSFKSCILIHSTVLKKDCHNVGYLISIGIPSRFEVSVFHDKKSTSAIKLSVLTFITFCNSKSQQDESVYFQPSINTVVKWRKSQT